MPGTERLEYEKEQGYYMCGINGCILAERHTGVCVMPDLPVRQRSRASSSKEAPSSSEPKESHSVSDCSKPPLSERSQRLRVR